ncbi:NPP1 family protein [Streptomyces sp. MBT53]|uniref:NPP1 family protein n=1 Tax=Streptomyces sp. MBT53 TaxID=1488384 RepID=UPI0027DA2FBB|nr:NPP1 family protein [Streptomyces sp. MBT53]
MQDLPESTTTFQKYFEPVYDHDTDSCYPTTVIDPAGNLVGGPKPTGSITDSADYWTPARRAVERGAQRPWPDCLPPAPIPMRSSAT